MRSVLVLGLGNRLMMDDGVGVAVVEALAAAPAVRETPPPTAPAVGPVRYAVGETDWDCCLALAEEASYLVVVDAVMLGRPPGTVTAIPLCELGAGGAGGGVGAGGALSLHDVHFLDVLRRVRPEQEGVLVGIEPCVIRVGLGLSERLAAALPEIVREVEGLLCGNGLVLPAVERQPATPCGES